MTPIDYKALLNETFKSISTLIAIREGAETQLAKQKQLYFATLNLLSEKERAAFQKQIDELADLGDGGLTEAIKSVLLASDGWMTTAMVRDKLRKTGFDFKKFESNPLASISTILRRWKPEEVETAQVEGVNAYRWKKVDYPAINIRDFQERLARALANDKGIELPSPEEDERPFNVRKK